MVPLTVFPLYAAILCLLYLGLSANIIRLRRTHRIGIGDKGNKQMLLAMRIQANFFEYVPLALLLLMALEINQHSPRLLHFLGSTLFISRILHAIGLNKTIGVSWQRASGVILSYGVILCSLFYLLKQLL